MSRASLFRLGLFQLGAGVVSVLLLGVLNRVLRVEMGMDLLLIGVVLGGGHYLGALIAIPIGFTSDRRPIRGLHRTPYILVGAAVVSLSLALAPFVARWLADSGSPLPPAAGLLFFLIEGIGTFVAGTTFLALLTDLTGESDRGRAVAWVWTLLMLGILAGVAFVALSLAEYSFDRLRLSFAVAGGSVAGLSLVALWRQEPPAFARQLPEATAKTLSESVGDLMASRATRFFFAFLVVGLFSMFMQDVVLEPFGGEVLGLSVRATSMFNAYQIVGTIGAMWWGGTRLIPRYGKSRVTAVGAWVQASAFGLIVVSGMLQLPWLAPLAILWLGSGMGLFTVGGVALMMDQTQSGQTGLFVGAWTLAQALARGPSAIAGSGLHNLMRALGTGPAGAYAAVFLIEAVGLAIAVWLLREAGAPHQDREEILLSELASHSMD